MSTLSITVPMPPNIANGSHGHWAVRDKQRKAYLKALDMWQLVKRIPPPPKQPLQRVSVDSVMHLSRAMDQDNAMRRHKWVMDWLTTRGYIADDGPKHLTWVSFPEQRVKMRDEYVIELQLTELPPL
jgi:hypothetical protein